MISSQRSLDKKKDRSGDLLVFTRLGITEHTLQRHNTVYSIQIFPEKDLRGLSPNFNIHVSVNYLYIPTIGLPILQENM